jgi:hypothetical protein
MIVIPIQRLNILIVQFISNGDDILFKVLRNIAIGEEINTFYSPDYFGTDNKECLCATCEKYFSNYNVDMVEADLRGKAMTLSSKGRSQALLIIMTKTSILKQLHLKNVIPLTSLVNAALVDYPWIKNHLAMQMIAILIG